MSHEITIDLLKAAFSSEHYPKLLSGLSTHEPALKLVAQLARHTANRTLIQAAAESGLPASYKGDTLRELPGMIDGAFEKGFAGKIDKRGAARASHDYEPGDVLPIPLGYYGGIFLFRNQRTNTVEKRTPTQLLNPAELMSLAPLDAWQDAYPRAGRRGEVLGLDAQAACDALIQACRKAGSVNGSDIRGLGVWRERGGIIVNTGQERIESKEFIYTAATRPLTLQPGEVSAAEIMAFLNAFSWTTPQAPVLVAGWAYASVLCGALDWRPHLAVSGPAGSGKTTILKMLGHLLTPMVRVFEGISTEAGVRQSIGPDAIPVVIDEFEVEGSRDLSRMNKLTKLLRSASGATGEVARGTPEGKALTFNMRVMFAIGAINIYTISSADSSRMVRVEVRRPGERTSSSVDVRALARRLESAGPAFCQHAVTHARDVLASIDVLRRVLKVQNEREADNLAPLLAGYFVLHHARTITDVEAAALAANMEPVLVQQRETFQQDDATECLNILLGHLVTLAGGNHLETYQAGRLLGALAYERMNPQSGTRLSGEISDLKLQLARSELPKLGIRVEDPAGFVVANSHPGMARIFRGTRWEGGLWSSALLRVEGARQLPQRRFADGVRSLAVLIPWATLGPPEEL